MDTTSRTAQALQAVRGAPSIVEALRRADDLCAAAAEDDHGSAAGLLREAVADPADRLTATAALRALGALPDGAGAADLLRTLRDGPPHLREHAAWALAEGAPLPEATSTLVALTSAGGVPGMLAQLALERWGRTDPDTVLGALSTPLADVTDASARARLVETVGLLPGQGPARCLLERAVDDAEAPPARAAAVAALGDREPAAEAVAALRSLAAGDGPLADTARTALHDLGAGPAATDRPEPGVEREGGGRPHDGLTVLQLFLHADIDGDLTQAGRGDNGGIATLLVQLGDALVTGEHATSRAVTVSRGRPRDATSGLDTIGGPGHHYASVPLWGPPVHAGEAWPLRVQARRGIRRVLRAAHPVDVVHLRMADVGSMAAAEAAAELGIPTVLTLAPDPHALVHAREQAGELARSTFGDADLREHLVLRDRLLRRLAADAAHLVLFPRPTLRADLRTLLGMDLDRPAGRTTVVAEGVDFGGLDRAATIIAGADDRGSTRPAALADLDGLLETLAPERRGLPVALTVGRLNRVKGMAALVEAWARHPDLSARCNLLVVGGDLDEPNDDESAELARIAATVPPAEGARRGLLLAGHRPNPVVKAWMAAVRRGRPGLAGPHGAYVAASLKEEFGIAILEALASGLVVVAPTEGGPATYVEHGVTGLLVDTASPVALGDAVARALTMAAEPESATLADTARVEVRKRFGIDAMADALGEVYRGVAGFGARP